MTSEASFLQAIAASPEDRAVRLVYADWLEDRDDPRAELIRIEEEMRTLPVVGDRYWRLKPRRNQLQITCGRTWLEAMGYVGNYEPLFRSIPAGWRERWRLIREFWERWFDVAIADVCGHPAEIARIEADVGWPLPPSVREWVAFHQDLDNEAFGVLRDCFTLEWLGDPPVLSLLVQAEGDYHWAVREADRFRDDPPVHGYSWDLDTDEDEIDENRFIHHRQCAASVSAWVLRRLMGGARRLDGFRVHVPDCDRLFQHLAEHFPAPAVFDDLTIFEARNILAYHADGVFTVELWKQMPPDAVPDVLWQYALRGRGLRGVFRDQIPF
jgi:uncharacterized protein (TIGR02996 family)